MSTSDRDRHFLLRCFQESDGSHDPVRKVGAIIVDEKGNILSAGTNSPPTALRLNVADSHSAIQKDPSWKYFMLEHAERAAIAAACFDNRLTSGSTMYTTLFPCADCARAIVNAGISRLVTIDAPRDPLRDEKWIDHYDYAEQIFSLANVRVDRIDPASIQSNASE